MIAKTLSSNLPSLLGLGSFCILFHNPRKKARVSKDRLFNHLPVLVWRSVPTTGSPHYSALLDEYFETGFDSFDYHPLERENVPYLCRMLYFVSYIAAGFLLQRNISIDPGVFVVIASSFNKML